VTREATASAEAPVSNTLELARNWLLRLHADREPPQTARSMHWPVEVAASDGRSSGWH